MTYKQIEASREARLWLTTVIVPLATTLIFVDCTHPEYKYNIKRGFDNKVSNIKNKFSKDKEAKFTVIK